VFSAAPTSYNLWSPRDHNRKFLENGNFVVHVPSLAPKELLIVDMIDLNPNAPRLLAVNCPDNLSWRVEFAPIRQFGFWVNSLIAYFMLAGLIGTIYLGLQLAFGA
jgi:hypothetical protein